METQKIFKFLSRMIMVGLFGYVYLNAEFVYAVTAEYKCTTQCNLCINFGKKVICSEKYSDDSEDYEKGRKLSRLVNDGLIVPTVDLKPNFALDGFAKAFFNCELMAKKVEQMKQATQNMCVTKTVQYKKTVPRSPASVSATPSNNSNSRDLTPPPSHEAKKKSKGDKSKEKKSERSIDNLIDQMDN